MAVSGTKTVSCDTLTQEFAPSRSEPEPKFSPLSKQNSILSLTLDEIQWKSGRSFGSMSMDEFLASIWSSDENQANPIPTHDGACHRSKSVATTEPNISQQGSFSVPPPICKKTVDEVWSEIHKGQEPQQRNEGNNNNLGRNETLRKQQTLGEMTLEDFLIKAGVVQESTLSSKSNSPQPRTTMPFQNQICNNRPLDASYGVRPPMGVGFSSQQNVGNRGTNNNGLATYPMLCQNNSSVARDTSTTLAVEKCQSLPESSGSSCRKRIIGGPPEVVVERRQRRMLKNRESAARSRARRQVYVLIIIHCLLHFNLICLLIMYL